MTLNQNIIVSYSDSSGQTVPELSWTPAACGNGTFFAELETNQSVKIIGWGITGQNSINGCGYMENPLLEIGSTVYCEFAGTPELEAIVHCD